jgi:hypothetical protein
MAAGLRSLCLSRLLFTLISQKFTLMRQINSLLGL